MTFPTSVRSPALSLAAVAVLLSAPPLRAQVPAAEAKGFATIQQAELRTDLTYIASDALEGRLSLQPGDEAATKWVAEQFAKAGLKPAGHDAAGKPSFLQPFTLIEYRPDRAASVITLKRAGKTTEYHAPQAFGAYKSAVDVTAPVVFAGFGITAPELHYDDYANLDAKGKIVLIFDHEPQEDDAHSVFNGTGNTRYATARVKVLNAQAHGAVAVLIVAEPNRKHLTNAERSARIGSSAVRPIQLPIQAIQDDEIHIPSGLVLDAVAAELFATSGTTPAAAQTIIDRDLKAQSMPLPDTTLSLHLRNVSERTGVTNNVVALLPGSDPKLAPETILISAHHDHDGEAACADPAHPPVTNPPDPHPCPQIWHGADDNGSGTVGVVALARAFAENPVKPKRSVLFVVFASEERGLLGAYWMAAHPLRPLALTRAQINFDMIGRDEAASPQTDGLIEIPKDTTNRLNLIGALYSPDYNRTVVEANKTVGLTLDDRFDHESALNVFFRSDQFPFVLHNIPAFWWFTGFHPDYHHTTDTVDKIDFVKMQKILQLAYLSTWQFATETAPPRFIANPGSR
ncbi:M20/M25/M40 family metallo-hydrolase [Granulicella tundricola]|uniref:Peptidase M28 n=1 Tax=Granulicella tundricola (strain ATCC BAA-1859 / DSM 23138 / MP5ACTX9) TaxID=1198114 RepID=E8WXA9_GRATM|nr:M20/M25/M40 family metallo-hydrolase [Granulicella tundricola]ADW67442.1 peptidase M28 [Granulicella tundricola MP5ACTX9]